MPTAFYREGLFAGRARYRAPLIFFAEKAEGRFIFFGRRGRFALNTPQNMCGRLLSGAFRGFAAPAVFFRFSRKKAVCLLTGFPRLW
jgi:hypothetical protein